MTGKEERINLAKDMNEAYYDFWQSKARELIAWGGAGSGKSYAAAQKIIFWLIRKNNKKILIIRKTYPALKRTCLELIEKLLSEYGIQYEINRTELVLTCNKNKVIFLSLDDPEKIKSITDVDLIWIEEPTELTEEEYEQVRLRLRGKKLSQGEYRQIILTFNPIDANHWLKKRFFDTVQEDVGIYKFTYKNNKFIDPEYVKVLEDLKNKDENFYRVYCLGEWGAYKNVIYTNYTVESFSGINFDEVVAGLDFGYNNPSAYLLVGIKDKEIYLIDEVYKDKLLTQELVSLIKEKNREYSVNPKIYCDTSDPDRIEELYRSGLNVHPAEKDVLRGINFLKTLKIHIHHNCVNTIKEIQGYRWEEDKNGNVLEKPVKFNDHTCDALRYCVYTHCRRSERKILDKPKGW